MRKLLNTLYVTTQGSYLRKENETIVVEQDKRQVLQLPIQTISGIVGFGNVLCSPFLLGHCAERGVAVSFLSKHGRFLASVRGPVSGNVLLRRSQYRKADDPMETRSIAAGIITAKISNTRVVMNRVLRDHSDKLEGIQVRRASDALAACIQHIESAVDTDALRGIEGNAAAHYFRVFNELIVDQKDAFLFKERSRRPPLDSVNSLLSFAYTILMHDIRSAIESVGLDPGVGFLHRDKPGRPGLALDMMEEFRSVIADRLVLSLINRRQVAPKGFTKAENGAVVMDKETRKTFLAEYQKRKQTEIHHPYINERIPIGLLFFVQANLMARFLRGDMDGYPPFFWR